MIRIYFDWNATTPPLPSALDAMRTAAVAQWANPASVHGEGRRARAAVESAREAVAELALADPRDVVLTSGGTEANNLAIRSAFARGPDGQGRVLVTSRLEHPSVTRVAEALEREGAARVHWLRVTPSGVIDLDDLARALDAGDVLLVAVQAVNHETGVIQPIDAVIDRALDARGGPVPVHVDAVQAYGRVAVRGLERATTRSLAAHKLRGPKGIGALVATCGYRVEPVLRGGAQEKGIRPGTVDPIACAGFAAAACEAKSGPMRYAPIEALRNRLEASLADVWPSAIKNGGEARAPHVSNVAFPGWDGAELAAALDLEGIAVSSGSACSAGTHEPSPVIEAMHDRARAKSSIRVSLGDLTTQDEVDRALEVFARVLVRANPA